MKVLVATIFLLALAPAASACRLALALALDVSGSVDQDEYSMQMNGLADALTDPDVSAALFAMPGVPVAIAVFEWSSSNYQRVVQDWVLVTDEAALTAVTARLRQWQRAPSPEATGIGAAMEFGKAMIDKGPVCWKSTLDISGDGKNNDWPTPRSLKHSGKVADIGINALVITQDRPGVGEAGELPAYFKALVIQGPGAFVEVAQGFEDYARAMRRKLLKELATQPMGALPGSPSWIALR